MLFDLDGDDVKKLGLLTYHRADNFGSCLQAYALQEFLTKNGYDVHVIDYHSPAQDKIYKLFSSINSIFDFVRNIQTLVYLNDMKQAKRRFNDFRINRLQLTSEYRYLTELEELNDNYDYFICGSDQIWNLKTTDFTPAYLLSFVKDKTKCVSYAPSLAQSDYSEDDCLLYQRYLEGFKSLSTRELGGAEYLSSILSREVKVVPDPVFLLSSSDWKSLLEDRPRRKRYVLGYFIGDVPQMRQYADDVAKKYGFELLTVNKSLRDLTIRCKKVYDFGPVQFLSALFYSDCIVTNSFHALAFSVIFKKRIKLFIRNKEIGVNDRCLSLLRLLGIPFDAVEDFIDFAKFQDDIVDSLVELGRSYIVSALE